MQSDIKARRKAEKGGHRAPESATSVSSTPPSAGTKAANEFVGAADSAQHLLAEGKFGEAREAFEAILAGLDVEPSYFRAAILERAGRCLLLEGRVDRAAASFQQALVVLNTIPQGDGAKALAGVLQSGLGDAHRATGNGEQARRAYEAAVGIAQARKDRRAEGIDLDHLGTLALAEGRRADALAYLGAALGIFQELGEPGLTAIARQHLGAAHAEGGEWDDATRDFAEAASLREAAGDFAAAAQASAHLAAAAERAGHSAAAEEAYRKAIVCSWQTKNPVFIRGHLNNLARFLLSPGGRLEEALQACEASFATAGGIETLDAGAWETYKILADILETGSKSATNDAERATQEAGARNYRHIQQYGPRLMATLKGLGDGAEYGRAVLMERLGRSLMMGGQVGSAVSVFEQALSIAETMAASDDVSRLRGVLQSDVGDALRFAGHLGAAREAYGVALKAAEELDDLLGQGAALDHLGCVALAEGQLEGALAHFKVAIGIFQELRDQAAEAIAQHHLASAFEQGEAWEDAARHFAASARIKDARGDTAGATQSRAWLDAVKEKARLAESEPKPEGADAPEHAGDVATTGFADVALEVRLYEEVSTECAFDSDLLIDVRRECKMVSWSGVHEPIAVDVIPVLAPRTRTSVDEDGAPRFYLPASEPQVEAYPGCTVMRKIRREVAVTGDAGLVWHLVRNMDGAATAGQILTGVTEEMRPIAAALLAALVDVGAVDASGRTMGRFLHAATKKGVLPGGGLVSDDVLRLATDGEYRTYAGAPQIPLGADVPGRLQGFHTVTRARRSRRDYSGRALRREEFDALLSTACGVTGAMEWGGREVKLRAYPSSGALYAVEIYPVIFRVEGLDAGVYHYVAGQHALDAVMPEARLEDFVAACLPVEREMVSGAAAMICLAGRFPRHERKYGEGGYRMMVAEAGHISQNLVLSAVALGLSARPFGGVFDGLVNKELGLEEADEQFLLSVLIGHAGSSKSEV